MINKFKKNTLISNFAKVTISILNLLPKKKNLIIFESFNGRQYSDNPRAIYEYLKKHQPHFQMIWSVDKRYLKNFENHDLKRIQKYSLKWFLLFFTAKYWVTNSRFPEWYPKSKKTTYLQTWHGTPLKKLGIDIENVKISGTNTDDYKKSFVKEASKWDYLISPNKYSTEIFKRAFGYQKQVIETGYPRNDILINENNEKTIQKIKKEAKLPIDKKILLYAPTWRDDEHANDGKYKFKLQLDLERMKKSLGDEYIVILRLHYLISEELELENYKNFAYNFSMYEDIRDLYLISDILITDYSSVFFDFGILEKPILFYVYDIDNYRDELRGFYFDFEYNSPGPLLKTTDEIIEVIKELKNQKQYYIEKAKEFKEKFNSLEDGEATKRVVERVFNK